MEFFIALVIVILCIGNYLWGYLYAKRECRSEIEALKHRKVEVKLIRPKKFVPVCVEERISRMDIATGGMDYQNILDGRMNYELMKELKPYIETETTRDEFTDRFVVRKSLVIIPWEEWAHHE